MTTDAAPSEITVLIADDQKIVRDGLAVLVGLMPGLRVVGTALDGADAVRQAATLRPSVVLMDLNMPNTDGVVATGEITATVAGVRVVALTTYDDDRWVHDALRAGARGYLTKDASAEEIESAIRSVVAGDAHLDPSVQRRLLERFVATPEPLAGPPGAAPIALTARESDVLRLVAEGRSNAEIAAELFVGDATVKTHVGHLLAKTGARDRAQLVVYAFRHGVVS
ncbi:response regulator transcription factor [Microlunatus ginsengisoli]|jgi:DNA-binding NarL/FixJ family response regulator|uniref:Response regulator transcription factor n=1 Tax=Microlunatus ginsengisoli TaxID=363863 RepID=A0ABP6ZSS3_9ACTN